VTVSRKVARLAVDRNRTRRIWREAIRLLRSQFAPGLDIVVNARVKPKGRLTMPEAREELLHLSTQEALLLPAPPSP
jgi:ribonuclease P protein component